MLLLSLLSKETGIIFVPISLIYVYLYQKEKLKSLIGSIIITLIAYSILRFGVAQVFFNKQGLSPITRISLLERLPSVPKIITFYLTTFLFPIYLSISQHWVVRSLTFTDFYWPLILSLDMTVAERWFYPAEVGLLGMAGILILDLKPIISRFSSFLTLKMSESLPTALIWKTTWE